MRNVDNCGWVGYGIGTYGDMAMDREEILCLQFGRGGIVVWKKLRSLTRLNLI